MRWLFIICLLGFVCGGCRGDSVTITIPPSISFYVSDVNAITAGSPSAFDISFTGLSLSNPGKSLHISVKASAANFTPPSGNAIPASKVFWTTGSASGGVGSSGTLSSSIYTDIFQSIPPATLGHVTMQWQLAPPGTNIRAGNHTLTIIYKVEAI